MIDDEMIWFTNFVRVDHMERLFVLEQLFFEKENVWMVRFIERFRRRC